jgi:hypothetical protein
MKDEGGCIFDIMKARSLGYAGGVVFGGIVCFASIYVSFLYESIRLSSVLFVALYFAMLAFVLISKFKNEYTIAFWFILLQMLSWMIIEVCYISIAGYSMIPGKNLPIESILNISHWPYVLYSIALFFAFIAIPISKALFSVFVRKKVVNGEDKSKSTLISLLVVVFSLTIYYVIRNAYNSFTDAFKIIILLFIFLASQIFSNILIRDYCQKTRVNIS